MTAQFIAGPVSDAKGDKQTIPTSEIGELCDSSISHMPENLCLQFKRQELRDLFAYIQSAKLPRLDHSETPAIVNDEDADLYVRVRRFSYNARGIIEMPSGQPSRVCNYSAMVSTRRAVRLNDSRRRRRLICCLPIRRERLGLSSGVSNMAYLHLLCLFLAACGADVENGTLAGRFVVEHPTLLNLGFEWQIRGDANRNATVMVQYRKVNDVEWRPALPLVRIGGEKIYREREHLDYTVPDGFAGSILNLQPGTEYECRFELTDPDGAVGETVQTVRVTTRSEPQPFKDGLTRHV
ncbi:MAG: hypothetical protein O2856_08640, partial [Planctomycetota bacterium]|nr:hypothetical protein [Planctomycetota bacterium]